MPSTDPLVARMRPYGVTIFAEMSALALQTKSVNLGQGFPDTDGPKELLDAAAAAIGGGQNQYPPGPGIPELRRAVAAHQQRKYGLSVDPDTDVLVTAGATEGIAAAVLAFAEAGDEVIVFEPYYDSYAASISLAGAQRRVVTLRREGDDWTFDPDALRAAVGPRTRLILLNTPHNPTGKVFTTAELGEIAAIAVENDLLVVSDEVYEHLIFDGLTHVPIATLPGMAERTVTLGSAGKTFSVTGWKIGWATGPAALIAAVRTVKQFLTFVNGAPFQPAVAHGLDNELYVDLAASLQKRRDQLCDGLADLGFDVVRPQATYFATVDVHGDAVAFCRSLPHEAGVVAIPSKVFYDSGAGDSYVRFAFCKRPEVLDEALRRLRSFAGRGTMDP
ncbi:MAG TPA: pyridoxal phosphate-dependent aminotransferase [Jatrophihabitantaceae bacterium]|nr:pyridoxal phosphate-dependent aminotransferase [Jatrophihabitantaceae bacterium]